MSEFVAAFHDLAPSFGLSLDNGSIERLERHYKLLVRWNSKINLTRIVEVRAAVQFHYLESVFLASFIESPVRVIDVGSGAGFPGIPLAVCRPDLSIQLVEPNLKRATFLRESARTLELSNIGIASRRFDRTEVADDDVIVSRALEGLDALLPELLSSRAADVVLLVSSSRVETSDAHARSIEIAPVPCSENRFVARFRRS